VSGWWNAPVNGLWIPSGYEFTSLMEAILHVSTGESGLSDKTKALVKTINTPVHIQVFATPT
jgi:alkyl hydroperoxide reductase subunit AhpF